MPVSKKNFQAGERVQFEGAEVTILRKNKGRGSVTIRNQYGYKQDVKPSKLKRLSD